MWLAAPSGRSSVFSGREPTISSRRAGTALLKDDRALEPLRELLEYQRLIEVVELRAKEGR